MIHVSYSLPVVRLQRAINRRRGSIFASVKGSVLFIHISRHLAVFTLEPYFLTLSVGSDSLATSIVFVGRYSNIIFLIPETCVSGIYCTISQFSVEFSQFVPENYQNTVYFEQKTFLYPFCISIECTRTGPDIRYVKWYT